MVEWSNLGIQIIIPVLTSTLAISGLTGIYNSIYNIPNPEIKLFHNQLADASTVIVKNPSLVSATNMLLTIELPKRIVSYGIFTTENLTLITSPKQQISGYMFFNKSNNTSNKNTNILQLYVSRFAPGNGSLVKTVILTDPQEKTIQGKYNVYTTYDGGSKWTGVVNLTSTSLQLSFQEQFKYFWNTYGKYAYFIPLVVYLPYFLWNKLIKVRYRRQVKFLIEYMKIMDSVYGTFMHNKTRCLERLTLLQSEFTEIFKKGRFPEWQYDLLNAKLLVYLTFIERKKTSAENFSAPIRP
jgi:hypothetical protein